MAKVRTRIAPSPTGDPHVGTAYIALFNLCFARQHQGEFILRIEDTDQVRSTPESEQAIFDSLRWLGLDWDEGPDVGGEFGPYRQSERSDIYKTHSQQLLDDDHAFHCFCSSERLNELRKTQMENKTQLGYDGHCLHLSKEDIDTKLAAGEEHVVRMKIPTEGVCTFNDMLRGSIDIEWAQIDMQVLMKGDGLPTYHLANVVDDHLMGITHVLRGEEWINSAPKHQLLYKYFGWDMPELCHMPLLRNPDKSKLSKRKNPTSINYYERMGYLPEALTNYLGRMGWSMPDESEKFSLTKMIENFDVNRVSLGGPIFDVEKLSWLNGQYIREDLNAEQFAERLQKWAFNKDYLDKILPHAQGRVEVLSDIAPLAAFYFSGMLTISEQDFADCKTGDDTVKLLQFVLWRMESQQQWNRDEIFEQIKSIAETTDYKLKDFLAPIFIAVAGTTSSVSIMDSMEILGPDISRARIRHGVNVLGGVSKKQMKKFEKEYKLL